MIGIFSADVRFTFFKTNYDKKQANDLAKHLRELPAQPVDLNEIVYNYDVAIANNLYYNPAIILLWQPWRLLQCETFHRLSFLNNLTAREDYNKFNQMSIRFQERALNLIAFVKVKISSLDIY